MQIKIRKNHGSNASFCLFVCMLVLFRTHIERERNFHTNWFGVLKI